MAKKKSTKKSAAAQTKSTRGKQGQPTKDSAAKKRKSPPRKSATNKKSARKVPSSKETKECTEPSCRDECVVVGVGASAGGLESFKVLLSHLPSDSGLAFVLVQHLAPDHESLMAELLSKYTFMPVIQVKDSTAIQPNTVYMIPPNKFIKVYQRGLFLDKPVKHRVMRMPIDYFFRSLAEHRQERAVAIILSGTGSDGTAGVKDIKANGGMVMVQSPESAAYDGMPRSACSTGVVDFVCKIEEMPGTLTRYARHPYVDRGSEGGATLLDSAPDHYQSIMNLLRAHTDYDFRCYKKGTLSRRIQRRMGLRHVENVAEYLQMLRKDHDEIDLLFKDLLISVTSFFREKEAWEDLNNEVISKIVSNKQYDQPVRVWVAGCATGEEAYSIAMLLHERFEQQKKNLSVQIFATDLDADAIDVAREGIYPANIAADLSPARLKRFFQEDDGRYRANKRLREMCVFAVQNLVGDPPFSNIDLITCRNVMIYLEHEIQTKMLKMFHFALRPTGYLFLGASESIGKSNKLFSPVSSQWRIFRKRTSAQRPVGNFPILPSDTRLSSPPPDSKTIYQEAYNTSELVRKHLVDKFAPASVVVTHDYQAQFFHGPVRQYLDIPSGEPTIDLMAMCLDGLRSKVRGLMLQCMKNGNPAIAVAPRVKRNGSQVAVRISVEPLSHQKDDDSLLLICFTDEPRPEVASFKETASADEQADSLGGKSSSIIGDNHATVIEQLEYELQDTREDLQSTIEELETSNEELKASNEEVMSMNEELQSTNEELETSREELQSLNEELSTVNNQLEEKVRELENTNDDLTNLLEGTKIATVFLDTDFRIRRCTPATTELLRVIPTDVGRPVSDLMPRFNDPDLYEDARQVLRTLAPIAREVAVEKGISPGRSNLESTDSTLSRRTRDEAEGRSKLYRWFMRRILPYRTSDNKIDGVVITFTDVTQLKHASRKLENRERQTAVIAKLGRAALAGEPPESLFATATKEISDVLNNHYSKVLKLLPGRKEMLLFAGVGWKDGLVGSATVDIGLDSQAGYTLQSPGPVLVENLAEEKRFSGPSLLVDHGVVSGLSVVIGPAENPWGVLGTHDVRERKFTIDDVNFVQAVANLLWDAIERIHKKEEMEALIEASSQIVWRTNAVGIVSEDSPGWREYTGQTFEQLREWGWLDALHPEDRNQIEKEWKQAVSNETPLTTEYRLWHHELGWRWNLVRVVPLKTRIGTVRGWVGMNSDLQDQKLAQDALQDSEHRFRSIFEMAGVSVWEEDFSHVKKALDDLNATGVTDLRGYLESNLDFVRDAMGKVRILDVNEETLQMFRTHEKKELLASLKNIFLPETDKFFIEELMALHEGTTLLQGEIPLKTLDNERIEALLSIRFPQKGGDYSRVIVTLTDITARNQTEEKLRKSEERLRLAADAAQFGTTDVDLLTGEIFWSDELKQLVGIKKDEAVPVGVGEVPEFVHPQDRERVAAFLKEWLTSSDENRVHEAEHRVELRDGNIRWVILRGKTIFAGEGKNRRRVRAVATLVDITGRKQFEEKLRHLNETLEHRVEERAGMIKLLHEVAAACHRATRFDEAASYVLHRFAEYNGWCFGHIYVPTPDNPDSLTVSEVYYCSDQKRFKKFREQTQKIAISRGQGLPGRVFDTGEAELTTDIADELITRRADLAEDLGVQTAAAFPVSLNGDVLMVLEFFSDRLTGMDDRIVEGMMSIGTQLARVVERSKLEHQLIQRGEEEQRRIAQDLHDTAGQELTGLSLLSKSLVNVLADRQDTELEKAKRVSDGLGEALQKIRGVIHGLSPVDLVEGGLQGALDRLAESVTSEDGAQCIVEYCEGVGEFNEETSNQIFRIVQEAVNNALRHSGAKQIQVSLKPENGYVNLTIDDNGKGVVDKPYRKCGMGMKTMQYRCNRLGGKFKIGIREGGGTQVRCIFPCEGN